MTTGMQFHEGGVELSPPRVSEGGKLCFLIIEINPMAFGWP